MRSGARLVIGASRNRVGRGLISVLACGLLGVTLPIPVPAWATMVTTPTAVSKPAAASMTAAGGWVWRNPLPQGNDLHAVTCASRCIAVGARGTNIFSDDGGATWAEGPALSITMNGVSCNGVDCYAVGDAGYVVSATYGWLSVPNVNAGTLRSISCPKPDCVVVGAAGIVMVGRGTFWPTQPAPTSADLTGVSCPSTTCFAVGTGGVILKTTDSGSSWASQLSPTTHDLAGVSCPSETVCYAVAGSLTGAAYSAILKTTNGGVSWSTSDFSGSSDGLMAISCPDIGSCVAVGSGRTGVAASVAVSTTDGGTTWATQNPAKAGLMAVSCDPGRPCVAVGAWGSIVTSPAVGGAWTIRTSGPMVPLRGISCPAASTCFAAGFMTVMASTDGGTTWADASSVATHVALNGISCPDVSTCYAVGQAAAIVKTADAGNSWTTQVSPSTANLLGISCPGLKTCVVVGAGGTVLTTANGGSDWLVSASGTASNLHGIACASSTVCVAVGDAGAIETTSDGGTTWTTRASGTTQTLSGVDCATASGCVAVGTNVSLATSDGGVNWTRQPQTATLFAVSCSAVERCVAAGRSTIITTGDGGASWTRQFFGTFRDLFGVSCPLRPTGCFVVGDGGTIISKPAPLVTAISPDTGPTVGGTSVVITGSRLSDTAAVTFGGIPAASFSVQGSDSVAAVSPPAGPGPVDVIVITPTGSSAATAVDRFTYFTPTPPGAPIEVGAIAGEGSASVAWSPPSSDGGAPITTYSVIASPGGVSAQVRAPATSVIISGLQDGTPYSFTVTAVNGVGAGPPSASSNSVVPGRGAYHPLVPARILDTRSGLGAPQAPLGAGGTLNVQITGVGGVPTTGVAAVVVNVTVTDTTTPSYLTVWPSGIARPQVSSLNWTAGKTIANLVEVATGVDGKVSVYTPIGSTDVIFDVAGYVGTPTTMVGPDGLYNPIVPNRVLDTRDGTGAVPTQPVGPGQTINVHVTGTLNIPTSGVAALALNVTATNPSQPGYLTVFPTGAARPTASNLNFAREQTVPNRVIVKVGTLNGSPGWVSFFNAAGSTDVIADIGGWFSDETNPTATGDRFVGLIPARIVDTRDGTGGHNGPIGAGETVGALVSGVGGVPAMTGAIPPTAVVLNVIVTNTTAPSYLTTWPDGATRPNVSDLNWVQWMTVPNLVLVKVGPDGKVNLYNAAGSADVVIDVVGWYG